jgi:hypothetical protein
MKLVPVSVSKHWFFNSLFDDTFQLSRLQGVDREDEYDFHGHDVMQFE